MNKTLLDRITNLEEELRELKAMAQQPPWTLDDIVPGLVVKGEGHDKCVIMSCGYRTYTREQKFWIGGLCGDPLQAYSTASVVTAQEMADYLNAMQLVKLGILETNFKAL